LVLFVGLALLVGKRLRARPLVGLALAGWGAFNVVDQLLFHVILGAHHIREDVDNYALYDWVFFALGLVLLTVGLSIAGAMRVTPARKAK
jgi:uncharacterized membrane protein